MPDLRVSAFPRTERHLLVFIPPDPLRSEGRRAKYKASSSSLAPFPDHSLRDRRDKNRLCASPADRASGATVSPLELPRL